MLDRFDVTLEKLTGSQPRRAYVYVPDWVAGATDTRLPVLYMFDGHNLFDDNEATYGKSWGLLRYLEETGAPLIVAAVECNHDPGGGRLMEYCPYTCTMPDFGPIRGRGKATMDFFVQEFKPYIDAHYPTLPQREYTFLGGSSMGGLMTLYGVMKYNKVFSRGAALSPSVWFGQEKLFSLLKNARVGQDTVLYMDYGQRELGNHAGLFHGLTQTASILLDKKVNLTFRLVPGGTHNEASWEKQIPFFIETLLYELP